MCEKINGSMCSRRAWGILRFLLGQRRTADGAARVALKDGIGSETFAEKAAEVLFPQASSPNSLTYEKDDTPAEEGELNQPFTMEALEDALRRINTHDAPGTDGITGSPIKYLPEECKVTLLAEFNRVWQEGSIPDDW